MFGKDISNNSGLYRELKRVQSKSINGMQKELPKPDNKLRESIKPPLNALLQKLEKPAGENPQLVPQYTEGILKHMINTDQVAIGSIQQSSNRPEDSKEITEAMRANLVDTLVDAHLKFKLLPQTLFKTIAILDRMLSRNEVSKSKLHLLGVSALFISAKYEEIYPPQPKSFVALSKGCSSSELIQMEGKALKVFEFNLVFPTALNYLDRLVVDLKLSEKEHFLCQYLLELSLLESKFSSIPAHKLAVASVFMMGYLLKKQLKLPFDQYSLTESEVKVVAKELCLALQAAPKLVYQMSRRKYSSFAFFEVSKLYLTPVTTEL